MASFDHYHVIDTTAAELLDGDRAAIAFYSALLVALVAVLAASVRVAGLLWAHCRPAARAARAELCAEIRLRGASGL